MKTEGFPNSLPLTGRGPLGLNQRPGPLMFTKYAERYVLRTPSAGKYLGVTGHDAQIRSSDTPDNAWIFHTHDGAVTHALWIGEVHGETPDVVRLDS
ncbi:MAG: Uncharacterised protein [Synechococcus sp. CC9902]|nr:MAG: Uncharacterised protein [Synechococcus sp. CC9902]|tara:strand:- start:2618 stop:2908 length:291 start_codon:yes stop_codon:yes gene_type:complete